jgi:hypothetical protein
MGAAVSITRLDLTASELRKAAGGEKSSDEQRGAVCIVEYFCEHLFCADELLPHQDHKK